MAAIASARSRFLRLFRGPDYVAASGVGAEEIWEGVARYYCESHRHYHTLTHILNCLREFDRCIDRIQNRHCVELAIWFHDVIYEQGRGDNELQSSRYFQAMCGRCFNEATIRTVCDLIVVTEHRHQPVTSDQQYICDIDLSSFGIPWEQFLGDSEALVEEEPVKDPGVIAQQKLKFLYALERREHIFYTDYFRRRLEDRARSNLRRYIEILERTAAPEE